MNAWVELDLGPHGRQRVRERPLVRGSFIERPHRFAARVRLADGSVVEAHLPNPGRLTGVLVPGGKLSVEGPFPPPRVLSYSVLAARFGRIWVGTVPAYANQVFPRLLEAGLFPELTARPPRPDPEGGSGNEVRPQYFGVRPHCSSCDVGGTELVRREVTHGRSRFDFEVDGRLVEVKSVSLAEGRAGLFPDAVTARGARHCEELARLARKGRRAAIVFVAQRADVMSVAAARQIDPAFADALDNAHRAGVLVLACALRMGPERARAARRIPAFARD